MKDFGLKDLGAAKQFLGVEIVRDLLAKEMWMHQSSYIRTLLDDLGMTDCNPAKTPMDASRPDCDSEPVLTDRRTEYQTLIGKLLFLSICTRPDISYAVNSLAQHSSAPRQTHFDAIKRVIRYLKGTASLGLHYKTESDVAAPKGFSDSDWAGEKDRRSVSGYAWFYGDCLVDWGSKKQNCVALSSTEAEYVALNDLHPVRNRSTFTRHSTQTKCVISDDSEVRQRGGDISHQRNKPSLKSEAHRYKVSLHSSPRRKRHFRDGLREVPAKLR